MSTVELNTDNFGEIVENNDIVIVDFWAPWCGPCQSFGPVYEEVSEKHEDIVFAKVNTEVEQALAGHFQVRSIPTLIVITSYSIHYTKLYEYPFLLSSRALVRFFENDPCSGGLHEDPGGHRGRRGRGHGTRNTGNLS